MASRKCFVLLACALAANVVVTLASLAVLPEFVAVHFGANGMADNWAPKGGHALWMTGIHIFLFVVFALSPRLVFAFPERWINLPNRHYWLSVERREVTRAKVALFMWSFGVAMFVFLLVTNMLALSANLKAVPQLNLRAFLPALAVLLVFTVWWTIAFFRAFRLPQASARIP